ncbi:MAG: serine hydrolase domain-containing protein, partial [Mycobacterium sp.]|uniref:serine hydrolase domain-containing protein n=1 Tax=Mycobacterium sp. TaxID=1785 RepID=UPI00262C7EE9
MANAPVLAFVIVSVALAFSGTAAAREITVAPDSLAGALQEALDREVSRLRVPGIQASVRVGRFTWSGVSGYQDLNRQHPLHPTDILRIGSVTKTFTAGVVLKLAERGLVNLDDPIARWLPDLPHAGKITVRHLLNHTSGLRNYTDDLWCLARTLLFPKRVWQPADLVAVIHGKPLYFDPGTAHHYSNTNYVLLGLISEKATGKPMVQLYRELIFDPLGLRNTSFVPYEPTPERLVTGFERDLIPFGIQRIPPDNTAWPTGAYAAGAIVSTSEDLRAWIDALFTSDFLRPETRVQMTRFVDATDPDIPAQTGYGLGLRRLVVDGNELWGHTGTIPGFGAAAFHWPKADATLAVISNLSVFDSVSV